MQKCETLRQPLLGELAMSRKKERERRRREQNAIYSGHLRLCQQPRVAQALHSDQLRALKNKVPPKMTRAMDQDKDLQVQDKDQKDQFCDLGNRIKW